MLVNGKHYRSVWLEKNKIKLINQLSLPYKFEIATLSSTDDLARAIKTMVVRGAPAIGAAAAYGMALAIKRGEEPGRAADTLRSTRPTAHDLFRGIDYVLEKTGLAEEGRKKEVAVKAAEAYAEKSVEACQKIGEFGMRVIKDGFSVLTHCNAGWLACVDWGTALAPVYAAKRDGKKLFVYVDETRPRLQGAKLTSWELLNEGVSHAVIADNAAGYYMRKREIDVVLVGADRIARNGDVVNKIGTYEKAVLARENRIPFYVAAPSTTIDVSCASGDEIRIEERDEEEIHFINGKRITPKQAEARNPAFDVTPANLIRGIITEKGIYSPVSIADVFRR